MDRTFKIILCMFFCILIFACTTEIHQSDIVLHKGKIYRTGDRHPYTGTVLGQIRGGHGSRYKKQYKNGLLNGKAYYWDANGKIERIEPYRNGRLNGMLVQYYPNGKIKARIHLVNGERGGAKGEMYWPENAPKSRQHG